MARSIVRPRGHSHTLYPWWEYFLGVMLSAYREFENRVGMVASGRGAKIALVRQMVSDSSAISLLRN